MKRILSILLGIALLMSAAAPVLAWGEDELRFESPNDSEYDTWGISGGYTYLVKDGEAYISAYSGSGGRLVIPSVLDGYPVVKIMDSVFEGNKTLTEVTIPDSIVSIGTKAFAGCDRITTLTIGDGVESVGDYAFWYCQVLTSLRMGSGVKTIGAYAFSNCQWLESLTLSESLTSIGSYAFESTKLIGIDIPKNVSSIEGAPFPACHKMTEIRVAEDNPYYKAVDGVLFSKDGKTLVQYPAGSPKVNYSVPVGTERIGAGAFYWSPTLQNVAIPEGVVSIGEYAFFSCMGITSFNLPDSLRKVEQRAFMDTGWMRAQPDGFLYLDSWMIVYKKGYKIGGATGDVIIAEGTKHIADQALFRCPDVQNIILPDGLITIGESAFADCNRYRRDIVIPDTVTTIGESAFSGCRINQLTLSSSITEIPPNAFYNCDMSQVELPPNLISIGTQAFMSNSILELVIPDKVKNLEHSAFYSNSSLKKVTLPEGLLTIGDYCFAGSHNLLEINLPESLTYVGEAAFAYAKITEVTLPPKLTSISRGLFIQCNKLEKVVVPAGVSSIGDEAFENCSALTEIIFEGAPPELLGDDVFYYNLPSGQGLISATLYFYSEHKHLWAPNGETKWNGMDIEMLFREYTLTFVAGGETVKTLLVNEDNPFNAADVPQVPQRNNCFAWWDVENLENIYTDTTVTAIYQQVEESGDFLVNIPPDTTTAALFKVLGIDGGNETVIKTGDTITLADAQYTAIVMGDVNCDGRVDSPDASSILRAVVKLENLENMQELAANTNFAASYGAADASAILRYVVKLQTSVGKLSTFAESGE
ncbi:MAG: leucine-rich repeat protein [Clostridia bacterium]|nr:leucine-rich repeat protein [Clostridia bacterium]